MARMDRGEYALADKMLGMAESRAQQLSPYKTFQIDNQRARFLLISRARTEDYRDHQAAYIKSAQLINKQLREARGKNDPYPLRLIISHEEFVEKRFKLLDDGAKQVCRRIIQAFGQKLADWPTYERQLEYAQWSTALERCASIAKT
jgi:hypothetical protein